MNIGKINKLNIEGQEQLVGSISTLHMKLKFRLEKNNNKQSDSAPDYTIFAKGSDGETPVGAVWTKVIDKFGQEPQEFFSMSFDDPSFSNALHVAAFKASGAHWDIVWRRRQSPAPQQSASTEIQ